MNKKKKRNKKKEHPHLLVVRRVENSFSVENFSFSVENFPDFRKPNTTKPATAPCRAVIGASMSTTLTSPHNLRDTKIRDYLSEMHDRERIAASLAEDDDESDANLHVCRTCARFTGLGGCDRYTLRRLHLRSDDIGAVMYGAGICTGDDDEVRAPSLVLADDDTCGEWSAPCA